jgi:hypothetical protein
MQVWCAENWRWWPWILAKRMGGNLSILTSMFEMSNNVRPISVTFFICIPGVHQLSAEIVIILYSGQNKL